MVQFKLRTALVATVMWFTSVCSFAAPIDPHNPPQGRFADDWMEIYFGTDKVGFAHSTMSRQDDRITTQIDFSLRLGRADQPIKISMSQSTTERLDGPPLEFASEMDASLMKTKSRGVIRDGKVTITDTQFGMDTSKTYDFPAGALMTWGAFRESLLRGFNPGTEYTLDVYSPELRLDAATKAVTKIGEIETFSFRKEQRQGRRTTVAMTTQVGSMELVSWVDPDGNPIKATMPMPGIGDFIMYTCDEAVALGDFAPPEFFMTTVIKAPTKLDRSAIKQIKYVLKAKEGNPSIGDLPATGMQKPTKRDDGAVELLVARQSHKPNPAANEQFDKSKLAEFLGSNLMINTEDPTLIELARKAADGEKEPFALGDKLRRFVTDHIHNKSLNIGFATASEVARTREGDCSEHGILLAALGRINGLPSRVVVGLAYVPFFGNEDDIFGYHMWTQFYINGQWYDFDAALRETECSPARIAFATSSLQDAGLVDLSLPLLGKIGAIDMTIVEVDGKPIAATAKNKP